MKRSACLLSLMSLLTGGLAAGLAGGCGDDGKGSGEESASESASNSNSNTMSSISISASASATETASATDGTASASVSDGSSTAAVPTEGTASEPTGGNTTFDPNDCGESVVNIPIVTPSVMLVLDKSGSMVATPGGFWDHDADDANDDMIKDSDPMMLEPATPKITRWESLWSVVDLIANGFNGSMNMGMILFPSKAAKADYSAVACVVNAEPEVKVGVENAAAIIAAIPPAKADKTVIQGGTPATKGVVAAVAELETAPADQPKFMILVTDGAANCPADAADNTALFEVYDEGLSAALADALTKGIKTYVVGIDISQEVSGTTKDGNPDSTNTYEKLNGVAEAGGVPRPGAEKFYNTTNQDELQAALDMISMQILSCTIDLSPSPVYLDYVEVTVKEKYGKLQVTDCATEDGWRYVEQVNPDDPVRIELCGAACSDFQMSGMIDIQYRCPNSG
jgi:Mg-chelatase subunit ChlD